MKAAIFEKYWTPEVLKIVDTKKPLAKDNEILVKIYSTAVTSWDCRMRRADPFLVRFITWLVNPAKRILWINFAWEVESIGKNVSQFKKGDRIYGSTGLSFWTYAEYISIKENAVIFKLDDSISLEDASAIIFWWMTALSFLEKWKIWKGDKILIYWASGSVWTAAVQIAKNMWAEVTSVCSWKNTEMVTSLWSDHVIDYTKEDFRKNKDTFDFVYDTIGKISFKDAKETLKKDGVYISNDARMSDYTELIKNSIFWGKKIVLWVASEKRAYLEKLNTLMKSWLFKAQIEKTYLLESIVEAHKHVETWHTKGNVVINVNKED
jgi:NADPH:quinone reductase-like Zn-dependent oxidoreductase